MSDPPRATNKLQIKPKKSFFPPLIINSNWSTCLRSQLCPNTSSLHTPPSHALTKPASRLSRDPPFDKDNFIWYTGATHNQNPTYMLLPTRNLWPSISCSTHSPFVLQKLDIPNHIFCATKSGYIKPCDRIYVPRTLKYQTRAYTWSINCIIIPRKDTMIPYMAQPRHPLTNQVLAMFFSSASIPATPLYSEFTDKCSPQYRKLSFSLHFPSRHETSLRCLFRSLFKILARGM